MDVSTAHDIVYTLYGHSITVSRREIEQLIRQVDFDGLCTCGRIIDSLQIQLGYTYTEEKWDAAPRDGFCGLHCSEKLLQAYSATEL